MSTAVLSHAPSYNTGGGQRTASGSSLGRQLLREQLTGCLGLTRRLVIMRPASLEDRLQSALGQTERAIRGRAAYLGAEQTKRLIARARQIFDPQEWGEGEPMPDAASAKTTLRAIATIGGEPSLGIAASGNVTATWQDESRSLSIEGLPHGTYKWAYVIERADDFVCVGDEESSLASVLEAMQA